MGVWDAIKKVTETLATVSEPVAQQIKADSELPACLATVLESALASGELAKATVSEPVAEQIKADSELPTCLATVLASALASGELAAAADQVTAEQGVLTFHYTWLQHIQTPLPVHLEDERKRLGVDEDDWQVR